MDASKLLPVLHSLIFILMYLECSLDALPISDTVLIQRAAEWEDTFCETKSFNQTLEAKSCDTVHVMNNYCYGQCKSVFMPYRKQGLFSCALSTPIKMKQLNITQQCNKGKDEKQKLIRLNIVEKCECKTTKSKYRLSQK